MRGGGGLGPAHLQDVAEFTRVLHLNVLGTLLPMKHAVPHLVASGRGSFVGMSSIAGEITHLWYDRPYFLGPDDSEGDYFALAAALREKEVDGVARWVMRKKEYAGALRADGDYLVLITLRHASEVTPASELTPPGGRDLEKREVEMAKRLVAAMEQVKDLLRSRPGATRVIIHVPAAGGGTALPMELRRGVAYDAELLAEVRRRLGDGLVDLHLATA